MNKRRKVTQLPRDPGVAAWRALLPNPHDFNPLEKDLVVDWAIVGAGFAGLSAARRLHQLLGSSERIALLEATDFAAGPCGRNSGFMLDLPHELNSNSYAGALEADRQQIAYNRHAIDFAAGVAAERSVDAGVFARSGKMTAAATAVGEQHLVQYAAHLKALNEPFEWRSAQTLQDLTGSHYYRRGLFTPGAAMIQPAAYLHALADTLQPRVEVFCNTPVITLHHGDLYTLQTPRGQVRARQVILAVNGHIQSFGFFPQRLMHVFTYASMTHALSASQLERLGGEANWGILPADPMGTTVRKVDDPLRGGARIVVRNEVTLNQSLAVGPRQMQRAARRQEHSFKARFPELADVAMAYRWGGRLCLSLNSAPAFGELAPRLWSACCQNGLGTVKGSMAGIAVAEMATAQPSALSKAFAAASGPSQLPPRPLLSLGANGVMKWKQWRAGAEV
ncbi:MAG: NAD(P)/FAD-dependent oxidoreductase [Pseudomonadales bacterium]